MMFSTRGRYALRVMIDLAEHCGEGYIPMKEVAARQDVSLKYIEKIMPDLTRSKLVEGIQGKGGGYRLTRRPDQYRVSEILECTDGALAPVACLKENAGPCGRAKACRTLRLWSDFYQMTKDYFDGITVADLMCPEKEPIGE